jgi:hypothetical protein
MLRIPFGRVLNRRSKGKANRHMAGQPKDAPVVWFGGVMGEDTGNQPRHFKPGEGRLLSMGWNERGNRMMLLKQVAQELGPSARQ